MEIKSINHHSRRKIIVPESEPSITDQSGASDSDINNIVARYKQTGVLPDIKQTAQQFIDCTQIRDYQDSKNTIAKANSLFHQLPAELRALMQNNPANTHNFFTDPRNKEILESYGYLATPIAPPTPDPLTEAIRDLSQHFKGPEDPNQKGSKGPTSEN